MSDKDPLAELNEHFARFMQHADGLLREWRSAIDEQTKDLQTRVQREVDAQLNESVRNSLARLRVEMDQLTARRGGGPASALPEPEARTRSWMLGALVSANVLLLVIVGLQVKSCADREEGAAAGSAPILAVADAGVRAVPPPPPPDAAVVVAAIDASVPDAAPAPKPKDDKKKPRKKSKKKSSKKRKKSAK